MFKTSPAATFVCLISLWALTMLVLTASAFPGCSGPASAQPCNFIALAKQGARQVRRHSPYLGFQVLDRGSSVYVHQPIPDGYMDGPPGVLIDKKSCRICEVDYYGSIPAGDDSRFIRRGKVLLSVPPERPRPVS